MKNKIPTFCDNVIKIALPIMLFFIPISNAVVSIAIVCAVVALIIKKIFEGPFKIRIPQLNLPLILFLFAVCVSVVNSIYLKSSLIGVRKWLMYSTIFLFITDIIKDKKYLKMLIVIFIVSACLVSIDAILQFVFGKDILYGHQTSITTFENFNIKRATGPFRNANDFSVYLVTIIPLSISISLYDNNKIRRLLYGIVSLVIGLSLFLTFFRGALLAFCVTIILVGVLRKDKRILLFLLVLLILAPFVLPKGATHWLVKNPSIFGFFLDHSRILHMKTALNMVKAHPFIGVGVNTFVPNYINYRPPEDGFVGWYAHNSFLQIAAEIGAVGLVIFLWLLAKFIYLWWREYKRQSDIYIKAVSLGLFAGTMAFLTAGLLESNLHYSRQAVLFWGMFGLTASMQNLKN